VITLQTKVDAFDSRGSCLKGVITWIIFLF
jgi:hypothetical protein